MKNQQTIITSVAFVSVGILAGLGLGAVFKKYYGATGGTPLRSFPLAQAAVASSSLSKSVLPRTDTFGFYIEQTGTPSTIKFMTYENCQTDSDITLSMTPYQISATQYNNGEQVEMGVAAYVKNNSGIYHIGFSQGEIKITDMDSNQEIFDALPSVQRSSRTVGPFSIVTLENALMRVAVQPSS